MLRLRLAPFLGLALSLAAFILPLAGLARCDEGHTPDIVAILKPGIKPQRRNQIVNAVRAKPVARVKLIVAAQVLEKLKKQFPDLPLDDVGNKSTLGDEVHIWLQSPQDKSALQAYLNSLQGVSRVRVWEVESPRPLKTKPSFLAAKHAWSRTIVLISEAILNGLAAIDPSIKRTSQQP